MTFCDFFIVFNAKFVESTKHKESEPKLALHIKNQEHNGRRIGAEWKKNRSRRGMEEEEQEN